VSYVPEGCCYPDCFNCPLGDCYAGGTFPGEREQTRKIEDFATIDGLDNRTMHRKIKQREYERSEKGKKVLLRYRKSEKGIATQERFKGTDKYKERNRRANTTEATREANKRYYYRHREEIRKKQNEYRRMKKQELLEERG